MTSASILLLCKVLNVAEKASEDYEQLRRQSQRDADEFQHHWQNALQLIQQQEQELEVSSIITVATANGILVSVSFFSGC